MPLFDYECQHCKKIEDVLMPARDIYFISPNCSICGRPMVRKISAPSRIIVRNNKPNKRRYEG